MGDILLTQYMVNLIKCYNDNWLGCYGFETFEEALELIEDAMTKSKSEVELELSVMEDNVAVRTMQMSKGQDWRAKIHLWRVLS